MLRGTAGVQSRYSWVILRVKWGYSQGTAGVQWGIVGTSRGTVVLVVCGGVCDGGGGADVWWCVVVCVWWCWWWRCVVVCVCGGVWWWCVCGGDSVR